MKHQLDFEKPIVELQNKLDELRGHPEMYSEEEIQLIEKSWMKRAGKFFPSHCMAARQARPAIQAALHA